MGNSHHTQLGMNLSEIAFEFFYLKLTYSGKATKFKEIYLLLCPSQKTSTVILFHKIYYFKWYVQPWSRIWEIILNTTSNTPLCPICTLEHIGQSWVNNDFCSVEQFINEAGLRLYNPIFIGRWTHWSSFTKWGYPFLVSPH